MNVTTIEDEITKWNNELARNLIFNDCIIVFYLLLGILGNFTVIYIYKFRMEDVNLDNRYFTAPLALMDMLASIIGSTHALMSNIYPVKIYNDTVCKTLWFTGQWIVGSSGLLLVVIAFHRYLMICRPFGFQLTLPWKRAAVVFVMFLSVGFSAPCLLFYGRADVFHPVKNVTGSSCQKLISKYDSEISIYNLIIFGAAIICIGCLAVFYGSLGRTIYRRMQRIKAKQKGPIYNDDQKALRQVDANNAEHLKKIFEANQSFSTEVSISYSSNSQTTCIVSKQQSRRRPKLDGLKTILSNHKYSWLFMTITIIFVVSFIPWNVITTLEAIDLEFWNKLSGVKLAVCLFFYQLYILNHVINPVIYGCFDGAFRMEVKEFFFGNCTKHEETE